MPADYKIPLCPFYPTPEEETCVCGAGSDISGGPACTIEDYKSCQWARQWEEEIIRSKIKRSCQPLC